MSGLSLARRGNRSVTTNHWQWVPYPSALFWRRVGQLPLLMPLPLLLLLPLPLLSHSNLLLNCHPERSGRRAPVDGSAALPVRRPRSRRPPIHPEIPIRPRGSPNRTVSKKALQTLRHKTVLSTILPSAPQNSPPAEFSSIPRRFSRRRRPLPTCSRPSLRNPAERDRFCKVFQLPARRMLLPQLPAEAFARGIHAKIATNPVCRAPSAPFLPIPIGPPATLGKSIASAALRRENPDAIRAPPVLFCPQVSDLPPPLTPYHPYA